MSDIFGIAKSGLQAYKEGLATTGQNIANVGNDSYARREAPISEVTSGKDVLQVSNTAGFGVRVDGITRAFDQFIDSQLQSAASNFSFSTSQAMVLNQLETVVRPAEGSVSQKIQELFSSLNSVAQDPSDLASRHVAADASKALVNSIKAVANGINDLRNFVSQDIENNIAEANDILGQLAVVQQQLLGISSNNRGPNELLDKTDVITTSYPVFVIYFVRFMLAPTQPGNSCFTPSCCFSKTLSTAPFGIHFANTSLDL